MAEQSGFFNANKLSDGTYDKTYDAADFANLFKLFFGDGVFANPADQLMVKAKNGLTVEVQPGWAFIRGYWYHLPEPTQVRFPAGSTGNYGVKLTLSNNKISLTQTAQSGNVMTETDTTKTIVLAYVNMKSGQSTISDADIVDARPDNTKCGLVTGNANQIESGELFAQFTDMFNTWFNRMKNQLTTDAAGNLQTQIDTLSTKVSTSENKIQELVLKTNKSIVKRGQKGSAVSLSPNAHRTIRINVVEIVDYEPIMARPYCGEPVLLYGWSLSEDSSGQYYMQGNVYNLSQSATKEITVSLEILYKKKD